MPVTIRTQCALPSVDPHANHVQEKDDRAIREKIGGALRRMYDLDETEELPPEFEALMRELESPKIEKA